MAIKLLAMDFDGVIPVEESPLYLFDQLGMRFESDQLAKEFYEGLLAAKTSKERDAVPGRVWEKSFALYKKFPMKKMKAVMKKLRFVKGAKELFNYCKKAGIKTAIISATIRPIIAWNLESRSIVPDYLISSECTSKNGFLDRLTHVNSPLEKENWLRKIIHENNLKNSQCLVVGDSLSEIHLFELVGKENSIAFNFRQDLEKYCGHLLFKQDDPDRDLRKIIEVIEKKN